MSNSQRPADNNKGAFERRGKVKIKIKRQKRLNIQNLSVKPALSAYKTQAISQPDTRAPKTNAAMPDIDNVILNKEWVDFNEK